MYFLTLPQIHKLLFIFFSVYRFLFVSDKFYWPLFKFIISVLCHRYSCADLILWVFMFYMLHLHLIFYNLCFFSVVFHFSLVWENVKLFELYSVMKTLNPYQIILSSDLSCGCGHLFVISHWNCDEFYSSYDVWYLLAFLDNFMYVRLLWTPFEILKCFLLDPSC